LQTCVFEKIIVGLSDACRYPGVCNSTLFGCDTSNPQGYVQVAMRAAMVAISKSLGAVQELQFSSPVKNGTQYSTLVMCTEVFTDCLEQVNASLSRVSSLKLQSLRSEVGDIQQYMAAALTYQDTCLTGVQDFGIWTGSDAVNGTHGTYTTMVLSNSLSLVNTLAKVTDFDQLFPHHTRRLLEDSGGEYFPHWVSREGRRLLQASNPTRNAVVALDGSGEFTSIQKAVDGAPSGGARWVIYVKKGTYSEYVSVPKGTKNLMMYGDGPGNTVITGKKSVVGTGTTTFLSATFGNPLPQPPSYCSHSNIALTLLMASLLQVTLKIFVLCLWKELL
jgi:pectinesterase